MSSHHSNDDHDPLDDGPVDSHDAETPRGGFMARPGLKAPPRHAVVVRVGDAPESEDIPVARASVPPPAPASEPVPVSASEKITLRAIPTPSTPPPQMSGATPPSAPGHAVESLPPPSDAPFVQSVRAPASRATRSRRSLSSRWTIVIAAAAGLVLGLASVATTMRSPHGAARAPSTAPTLEAAGARLTPTTALAAAPSASARPRPVTADQRTGSQPQPAPRPASPGAKRSIF
jgi:hypothetical protein